MEWVNGYNKIPVRNSPLRKEDLCDLLFNEKHLGKISIRAAGRIAG